MSHVSTTTPSFRLNIGITVQDSGRQHLALSSATHRGPQHPSCASVSIRLNASSDIFCTRDLSFGLLIVQASAKSGLIGRCSCREAWRRCMHDLYMTISSEPGESGFLWRLLMKNICEVKEVSFSFCALEQIMEHCRLTRPSTPTQI